MAGRPRFHTTTSRAPRTPRTPGVPSSHLATTLEMQQALMAMQQALARRVACLQSPDLCHAGEVSLNCYKCGKPGHVERMCRSGGRRSTTPGLEAAVSVPQLTSGAVLVAGTAPCPHPTLHVSVTSGGRATCEVMAVADTGAQVAAGASQAPPARQPGLMEAPTRPAAIPLPPLEENVGRLEEWLLRHFSSSTFNVGRCPLPVMAARCNHKVDQHWRRALRRRELAMARSGDERVERQGPVRTLEPLSPGSRVWVQNQMTKVWDRSGVVAEALPHRQYTVRLDGSGRLSLRNRRHLRVKRGATLASPAPSHAGPTPATSPTPQPRQSTPSRPRRTSRRPQWLADYNESSPP
ncbi:hypothetical protein O3P69_009214 [Scylla paramamosain]|uniref:CCHC-type domain-containing protein n=1 Tax=Scylla paramamosain TaxID=85552 RepID=A0AAW0TBE9_SCYPA